MTIRNGGHEHNTPAMFENAHEGDKQCLGRGIVSVRVGQEIDRLRGDIPGPHIRQR
jgi:hypothetical protein